MKRRIIRIVILTAIFICIVVFLVNKNNPFWNPNKSYHNLQVYQPVQIDESRLVQQPVPKNIILFIGDGMGLSHVFAGITANQGRLNLEYLKYIGFSKSQSSNRYVTDSAASATAMASGVKTYNGAIGVDTDTVHATTILELAENQGFSTGLVSTSAVTHATPAAFIAHQKCRKMRESIAEDFLKTEVDVVIGGGWEHFAERKDGQSLIPLLEDKGYTVITDTSRLTINGDDKLFALLDKEHLVKARDRQGLLTRAVKAALSRLNRNNKGFFLMVEGSHIDWGGHDNDTRYIVEEVLDMDRALGAALEFAAQEGETLILCTADHETGGMACEGGDILKGLVRADYTSKKHTGVMIPVFSNGPGADQFIGIYENTELFYKMKRLLEL